MSSQVEYRCPPWSTMKKVLRDNMRDSVRGEKEECKVLTMPAHSSSQGLSVPGGCCVYSDACLQRKQKHACLKPVCQHFASTIL